MTLVGTRLRCPALHHSLSFGSFVSWFNSVFAGLGIEPSTSLMPGKGSYPPDPLSAFSVLKPGLIKLPSMGDLELMIFLTSPSHSLPWIITVP